MNIEELMMPIDEWNKQFSCKYMQQPISFLTEENLDRLQQHCEKTIQYGNGRILEEHQVTLELIIKYKELQQELKKEKEKNKELLEQNKDMKALFNIQASIAKELDFNTNEKMVKFKDEYYMPDTMAINANIGESKTIELRYISATKYLTKFDMEE